MSAKVHYLHARPEPIGHFLRIGNTGHRQLETLHSAGRFSADRLVFEAGWIDVQKELVGAMQEAGGEIVLDPNVAELSALGRFEGAARRLPWAKESRPLEAGDFGSEMSGQIARFAVARRVHVVLAPTHLLTSSSDELLKVDIRSCEALRKALDSEGGRHIAIDYPLLTTYAVLRDRPQRRSFISRLQDLPFDNLWLRISGFGADASAVGVRRYITALIDLHTLTKPIVADCVGGLASLAVASFGGSGAIAHGVAEKERFDASEWNRPRRVGGGGQSGRLYVPGLDRLIPVSDARILFDTRGARRLLSCRDVDCCPRGADDTLKDPRGHFLKQREKQILDLSAVPEQRRAERFLAQQLSGADRTARQAAKLQPGNERVAQTLTNASIRLDRLRRVLKALHDAVGNEFSRSKCPPHRARTVDVAISEIG